MEAQVVSTQDLDELKWELLENDTDSIEATRGPEAWSVGVEGDSIFSMPLVDLLGRPVQVLMQVQWAAIDQSFVYKRRLGPNDEFAPTFEILSVILLEPQKLVYLVDSPVDRPNDGYTLQSAFDAEPNMWAQEAIDDNYDELLYLPSY